MRRISAASLVQNSGYSLFWIEMAIGRKSNNYNARNLLFLNFIF